MDAFAEAVGGRTLRLIDADALRESLFESSQFDTYNDYSMVIDTIDLAPTIEEQKKAKWVKDKTNQRYCSACGQYGVYSEKFGTLHTFYCPYCGTKMEEEQ